MVDLLKKLPFRLTQLFANICNTRRKKKYHKIHFLYVLFAWSALFDVENNNNNNIEEAVIFTRLKKKKK